MSNGTTGQYVVPGYEEEIGAAHEPEHMVEEREAAIVRRWAAIRAARDEVPL